MCTKILFRKGGIKIDKKLKSGLIYNFIAKYSNVLISLVLTSILARLLSPDDFGIVGVVMVFVTFFNMLGDMGFGPAIIQNKKLNKDEVEEIFTFTIIIAIVSAIIFAIFSYFIAYFYSNKVYIGIGKSLAIAIFFYIVNIVPTAVLYKEKRFKLVAIGSVIINIIVGIIAIIVALHGARYYTLVIQSILSSFFTFLCNLYFSKVKSKFYIDLKSVKKISNYSKFQFMFNIINYFSRNSDNILIGKFLGVDALGLYDKAYKLMLYPVQNLTFVITPVLHPILSEYQDNIEIILSHYKKIVKILAILGGFFSVICFFGAREMIMILFGTQWSGSVIAFKILAITIVFQIVASSSGVIFQSTGEVSKLFVSGCISAFINVVGIVLGIIGEQIEYVALGITIAFIVNFFITFFILIKLVFKENYFKFLFVFKNIFLAIIFSSTILYFVNINIKSMIISLVIKTIICFISYGTIIILSGDYKSLMRLKR